MILRVLVAVDPTRGARSPVYPGTRIHGSADKHSGFWQAGNLWFLRFGLYSDAYRCVRIRHCACI